MNLRSTALTLVALLVITPAASGLLAQQAPAAPSVDAATGLAGIANAVQGVANSTAAPTAQTPIQSAMPQLPQPGGASANGGVRAPAMQAPRGALAGRRPAAPRAANVATTNTATASAAANTASGMATPPASMDTMLSKLAPQMDLRLGAQNSGGLRLSGTVGIIVMMGLLTLLPTLVLLMTGFTRILIVLNFLRQALGTQNAPPAQLVAALSLILTGFVMAPTLNKVNETALQPWMNGKMEQAEMMKTAVIPFREFMLKHTRDHDLQVFIDMSSGVAPRNEDEVPLVTLVSAFATSELRTAFQIGFALFLPFIIIDIVVSSVLMSMGMFMLPPAMISLPFKLLLFVLVDGWTLVVQSLVTSFRV